MIKHICTKAMRDYAENMAKTSMELADVPGMEQTAEIMARNARTMLNASIIIDEDNEIGVVAGDGQVFGLVDYDTTQFCLSEDGRTLTAKITGSEYRPRLIMSPIKF